MARWVEIIAFADDVTLIATKTIIAEVKEKLNHVPEVTTYWLEKAVLEITPEKSEALIITRKGKNNSMRINIQGFNVETSSYIRYLKIMKRRSLKKRLKSWPE